ncbi:MAG: hypothetical protein WCF07_10105 [Nitrososphaeraceae archaeon]
MDPEHYNSYLQESGFIKPLKDWVLNVWSRVPFFKIVAYQVPDPLVLDALGNKITNQKFRLKITRGKNETTGNMRKKIIYLDYYDTKVEDVTRELCKCEPSFLSCGHIYQIILNAIRTTELMLDSEAAVESFLEATKWNTFGFFRSRLLGHDQVFLIVLFPLEFYQDENLRIELMN